MKKVKRAFKDGQICKLGATAYCCYQIQTRNDHTVYRCGAARQTDVVVWLDDKPSSCIIIK